MLQWVGVSTSEQWVPRGWTPSGCWQLRTWSWGHSPPTLPRPLGGLLPAPASLPGANSCRKAGHGDAVVSPPHAVSLHIHVHRPLQVPQQQARAEQSQIILSVNGASLCVCSAPVPTVMVVVMVLQGVCFSNTTVLEPCLLWFRSRNSQPYVHTGQEPQGCGVLPLSSRGVGLGARRVQGCLRARQPQVNSSRMGERN